MSNTLATILDDASNRLLVEKYREKKFLERTSYDTVLANSTFAQRLRLPERGGLYLQATRKGVVRLPQNLSLTTPTSDPASGALLTGEKLNVPMEFIQEYAGVGTVAQWLSWIDIEDWVTEELPLALMRTAHYRTQAAFKVGRYQPGVWSATSNVATTPFWTTAEATVTIEGTSFTFADATHYFVGGKSAFAALNENDRHCMADYLRIKTRMKNSRIPMVNGRYIAVISEAVKDDLLRDDRYFQAAVHAWSGKGIAEGQIADYSGIAWVIDDEPFTENWGATNVRATSGPIHTSFMFGKNAFAYLKLGGKDSLKPTMKVQDITKTGVEKTLGYTIPFQVCVVDSEWCADVTGPVTEPDTNV